jgi:arylsulfatase A
LRDGGYATCHVGKWHCNGKFNSPEQPQPGDHGFEHWFSTQNNAAPTHHNPRNFVRNGERVGPLEGYSCQLVADEAIRWLKEGRDKEKPFFQFVCFHEPHEPIASPPELVSQYPNATKRGEALYYANVTNMDRAVGRLMKALDELELAGDTLVFFTSDNGPETLNRYKNAWRSHGSPGPLRGMKLHVYEGGIRVPGILRFPGRVEPGQESDAVVCSLDLLPTFCELAGVEPPQDRALNGTSFVPLLSGKPIERETPLYWHYYQAIGEPKAAMRIGDYMILGHWDGARSGGTVGADDVETIKRAKLTDFELYNLRDDLAQQHDLAAAEPERLKAMSAQLVKKYREVQAEGPRWKFPQRGKK